jgi:glycosyltransferase involved in cell wall biosynthesis
MVARSLARPLFRRAAVVTATSRQAGESVQNLAGRFVGSEHIHPIPIESRGHPWTRGGGGVVLIGHLARADLLLHCTRGDETPTSVLDALVAGVPVVACWDGGAVVEVVPESGAGRLSIPSADALAENVLNLLADPDRLALTRLVGEAWRARLAPDHVAQWCEGWYRHALAS